MKASTKTAIIIPAYNEATVLGSTIRELRKLKLKLDLVVINDGSTDNTAEVAESADYIISHRKNCGLGAALATGIEFARREGYDSLITFDADGQHDPQDIAKALKALDSGADVVIGSRFRGTHSNMPGARRLILAVGDLVTLLFFGVKTTDSQSGFRGLSRRAIESIRLTSNRMEVSSEFFGEIRRLGLKLVEIPITVRYTEYSLSKGQSNSNGLKVLIKLLYRIIR